MSAVPYVAEQERKKIKQRQRKGLKRPLVKEFDSKDQSRGVIEEFKKVYREWKSGGMTAVAAMKQLGLKPNTFYRRAKELEKM